jgi:O-antigen/teichoic acid export membrane protein
MSLKKQTLWSMAPLLVVTFINVISVPLFYRYLGPEMYALWFYVQTLSGSFGFMDLGLGTAVGRYLGVALGKGDREAVKSYWATGNAAAIPLLCLMGGVFVLVGVLFGPKWFNISTTNESLLQWSFVAGGLSLFLSYYNMFWNVLSQAHLDFRFLSLVRIGTTFLAVIPSLLLAKVTGNPLLLILWGTLVAAIQLVVFIVHARISYHIGIEWTHASLARLKEMAHYTGKTFATILINSLFGSIDRLILGKLAQPAAFANYTIASNMGARLGAFSMAAAAPVFSNTSRISADTEAPARIYNETFRLLIGWYALAVVWIAVWHQPIARLWLGSAIGSQVGPLLPPLVLAYALAAISIISSSQLGALDRVGTQAIFHLVSGLATIPAVYFGWKMGGLYGTSLGFLLSRVPLFVQDIYLIRLIRAEGWLSGKTWKHLLAQAAIGGAILVFLYLVQLPEGFSLILAFLHAGAVSIWLIQRARS